MTIQCSLKFVARGDKRQIYLLLEVCHQIDVKKETLMEQDNNKLEAILSSYKGKKGILIPMLQAVQNELGYLSKDTMKFVADFMQIPAAEIFGVATFYSMFRLKPQGKHIIRVCKGTACHVSDADGIKAALVEALMLPEGENTTPDMLFTLMEVACLGCCSLAPVIMIDDTTYGKLVPEAIPAILEKFHF